MPRRGRRRAGAGRSHPELLAQLAEVSVRDEHRLRRAIERLPADLESEQAHIALARVQAELAEAQVRLARRRSAVPAVAYPPELPISERREELLTAIRDNQVVVVAGETGSGKTTQLPKLCLELGRGVRGGIAHTQPRRIAARTVAERIADELGVQLGEAVGYSVRFNDRSREDTLIRLMTDGLLLAEIQNDRLLRRYDTIILDEAHERSLNIDFLLGYLKQILPRRPDLKLIITSATIDPERFARHFGDAPVVSVSGRTYPVEVRYRPLTDEAEAETDPEAAEERDELDAISDAVTELLREGPGDVLVFLSGEREIRDAAKSLSGTLTPSVEVLPLYARLSASEQQKIFKPHNRRRVVLSTNVAETSLTVPGIRYVIDTGTARISRYSARLKVQRLPIEKISQASADQRKGRCGRTSAGICIRLYSEEDFATRSRYTDPEILRTSLASVILQMAALRLGDIEQFPFLDPPDARQIRDGLTLLHELSALADGAAGAERRLTPLGRRLAQLPVDPRFARMVLEADRLGCASEVIVIAAGLSIQDPRERPTERQQAADAMHARFADPSSDFLGYLNLWRYLTEQQEELGSNQFRRRCRQEFIHFLRVREWQDLVGQLRRSAREVGIKLNAGEAEPRAVHTALLSGLLSHVGLRDVQRREYAGARGARFAIFPGSTLVKRQPEWAMVAELVETSRLWGRTAARIDPKWVEPLAGHLVKRSYDEPHWERKRASVVASERVTLYGLPIVAGRKVPYGAINPELSRQEFIQRALVEGDWDTRHAFVRENRRLLDEIEELEQRVRRRDIRVDDAVLFDFYDARIPVETVSGAHFDSWWKKRRRRDPDLLTFTRELLVNPEVTGDVDAAAWPQAWRQGDLELALSYRFEPGSEDDGVTVHVPLALLGQLRPEGFEWLVPALRPELVTALVRSLPKDLRRRLVPVPNLVDELMRRLGPPSGPLLEVLAAEIERLRGVRVPAAAWDLTRLAPHLRVSFRVEGHNGALLGKGHDLDELREQLRPRLRAELAAATRGVEQTGLHSWTIGALPRVVTLAGAGQAVRGYPALADEGDSVAVRVLDTPQAQAEAMRAGIRRLLLLACPSPFRHVQSRLPNTAALTLMSAPHGNPVAALEDAALAAIDALVEAGGGPVWEEQSFAVLRHYVAGNLAETATKVTAWLVRIIAASRQLERRLETMRAPELEPVRRDVERQMQRLVHPGFVTAVGVKRLPDVHRYLSAAIKRLDRLPAGLAVDLDRMKAIDQHEAELRRRAGGDRPLAELPDELREVAWMLEELRVSHFAQELGTSGAVSSKRIRRALEQAPASV
ncbi:MAG: ATP-dependent RNA helicase HrpA [Actinomycetota bacterium]|nr:ATP-dependent RNA helicase HrpA [Actinomycetota bacterium]